MKKMMSSLQIALYCCLLVFLSSMSSQLVAAKPSNEQYRVQEAFDGEHPILVEDHGDQVDDPEEVEDPNFILIEPLSKPELSKPEQVIDFVHASLGVEWEWSEKAPNVVVVRNAGVGYQPSSSEAAYDDLILVVTRDNVYQFAYANAEGTEHRTYVNKYGYNKYVDSAVGKAMTPALDAGRYKFKVALHSGQYKALHVYSWDWERFGLDSQRRNGKYGKYEVGAVNVHKGGSTWNWSVGCLTIHYARWDNFIKHFDMNAAGRMYLIGQWNGLYGATANRETMSSSVEERSRNLRRSRYGEKLRHKLEGPMLLDNTWPFLRRVH